MFDRLYRISDAMKSHQMKKKKICPKTNETNGYINLHLRKKHCTECDAYLRISDAMKL